MDEQKDIIFLTRIPETKLDDFEYPVISIIPKPFPGGMSMRLWEHMIIALKQLKDDRSLTLLKQVEPLPPDDPCGGRRFCHIHFEGSIIPVERELFKELLIDATTQMVENIDPGADYGGIVDLINSLAIGTIPLPERERMIG